VRTKEIYEPEVMEAMLRFVQPGDKVIDCGANLGLLSLCFSQLVGNKGEVIAFEPDDRHFAELVENVNLNKANNICCYKQALWHTDEWMDFYSLPYGGYSSFIHYTREESVWQKVFARSLDSIIDPACPIRLIKIDCEGAEAAILYGAEKLLRRGVDCVLVEFNYYLLDVTSISEKTIRDWMHSLGYDFFFLHRDGSPPLYIKPGVPVKAVNDINIVNVMFSTREKVAKAWNC